MKMASREAMLATANSPATMDGMPVITSTKNVMARASRPGSPMTMALARRGRGGAAGGGAAFLLRDAGPEDLQVLTHRCLLSSGRHGSPSEC